MYRWIQHRGATSKRRLRPADDDTGWISGGRQRRVDTHYLAHNPIDFTTLRRRALALSALTVFVISSVGAWYLPAAHAPLSGAVAIQGAGPPAASKPSNAKSFTRHGFTLKTHPRYKARLKRSSQQAERESQVKNLVELLNERIELPVDVEFSFEECGDSYVYYDDDYNRVIICQQWFDEMERVLSRGLPEKTVLRQTVRSLAFAVLLHETAHALIDVLNIPVTGREEDAADQFSTLVLLNQKDGARKAMQVAYTYKVLSQDTRYPQVYWDEHSLDIQRYYDTLCMVYGRDPKQNERLLVNNPLPDERAEICESQYKRIERSWKQLLTPYAKDSFWQAQ